MGEAPTDERDRDLWLNVNKPSDRPLHALCDHDIPEELFDTVKFPANRTDASVAAASAEFDTARQGYAPTNEPGAIDFEQDRRTTNGIELYLYQNSTNTLTQVNDEPIATPTHDHPAANVIDVLFDFVRTGHVEVGVERLEFPFELSEDLLVSTPGPLSGYRLVEINREVVSTHDDAMRRWSERQRGRAATVCEFSRIVTTTGTRTRDTALPNATDAAEADAESGPTAPIARPADTATSNDNAEDTADGPSEHNPMRANFHETGTCSPA